MSDSTRDAWNAKSIAAYLDTSRTTVHLTLKKWAEEQFAGIAEHSRAPHQHAHKTTLRAMLRLSKSSRRTRNWEPIA